MPLRVYFTHGLAKVELALARGRRAHEKRQAIAKREHEREMRRSSAGAAEVRSGAVADTIPDPTSSTRSSRFVADEARKYLDGIADRPVRDAAAEDAAASFGGPLPEEGAGAVPALEELLDGQAGLVHSAGPRFFHFVNGGTTPAALGADWLTSTWDQNPGRVGVHAARGHLESVALGWLQELFGLPAVVGRRAHLGRDDGQLHRARLRRRWWGLRHGVDVDRDGLGGLPPMPVFGVRLRAPERREGARRCSGSGATRCQRSRDGVGRLDVEALERALRATRRRAGDRDRERRRGERGRLRPAPGDGRPRRAIRRVAARRRRVRPLRGRLGADPPPGRGDRAGRLGDRGRPQVAERRRTTAGSRS